MFLFCSKPELLRLTILALFIAINCLGQSRSDTLLANWTNPEKSDSIRINDFRNYIWENVLFSYPDSAGNLAQYLISFSAEAGSAGGLSQGYRLLGIANHLQSNYVDALKAFERSLHHKRNTNDSALICSGLMDVGNVYSAIGKSAKAIHYYKQALEIKELLGDSSAIGYELNNIGAIYSGLNDLEKAEHYYQRSHQVLSEIGDEQGQALSLKNIGFIKHRQGADSLALKFYFQALNLLNKIEAKHDRAACLGYIGMSYQNLKDYTQASFYTRQSLKLFQEVGDRKGMAVIYNQMGELSLAIPDIEAALGYCTEAFSHADEVGVLREKKHACECLYSANKEKANENEALKYLEIKNSVEAELEGQEAAKQLQQLEFDKKLREDSLENVRSAMEMKQAHEHEVSAKNKAKNLFAFAVGVVMILAGAVYFRLRKTRIQKQEIEAEKDVVEQQKKQVERKNEEFVASVSYAKNLQTAAIPTESAISEVFPESFVLYLPRDIVSGDFYWIESKGDVDYFAVADCTGHGVPGAMLSVIGVNGLNRAVNEQGLTEPKDILSSLSEYVQRHFEKSESTVRDGMDICLCALHRTAKVLTYSGANNPVWIARNGEMHILKGDRKSIGHTETDHLFNQVEFQTKKGDTVYLSSDGFQDQLGGPRDKKFMRKSFREKLLAISIKPVREQQAELEASHLEWRGAKDQTDDICVFGIRLS